LKAVEEALRTVSAQDAAVWFEHCGYCHSYEKRYIIYFCLLICKSI